MMHLCREQLYLPASASSPPADSWGKARSFPGLRQLRELHWIQKLPQWPSQSSSTPFLPPSTVARIRYTGK